jgi:molecular chaperone Hsp33
MNEELKQKFKNRDRISKALSNGGKIRAAVIKNTNTSIEAQKRHKLDFISAALLSRLMAGAGLMSSFMKGEERVILEMQGNGPVSKLYAEALRVGEIRAFAEHRSEIEPEKITDFRDAIGIGLLTVTKVVYNENEPTKGIVPIEKGDIASDLVQYFLQSEQIPTALVLDVKLDDDGNVTDSGGLIVQAMPGADEDLLQNISEKLSSGISICDMLNQDKTTEEVLFDILGEEFKPTGTVQTDFYCRCSKDTFKNKVLLLGVNEIKDMKSQNQNELICKYCNEHYYLETEDFDELITSAQATVN